jgi:photosystem II stability/assembly factor-like uncharacterized protein
MAERILVGTVGGLWTLQGDSAVADETLAGRPVTALAREGATLWAIVEGAALWERHGGHERGDGAWRQRAAISGPPATCIAPTPNGLLVGTEQAHLLRLAGDALVPVDTFDNADGRATWYTPWGDPAGVRSLAVAADGTIHVNVHVGGVVRSRDGGVSWAPTMDIENDVHQVLAHPTRAEIVLVASAEGFGISRDGGDTWQLSTTALHAHYLRAVAVAGDHVLISASAGFHGRRSAIYRRRLDGATRFERCEAGLPRWFDDNIDTACLAATDSLAVCGTSDGRVFQSSDTGAHWTQQAKGLPPVSCVLLD